MILKMRKENKRKERKRKEKRGKEKKRKERKRKEKKRKNLFHLDNVFINYLNVDKKMLKC